MNPWLKKLSPEQQNRLLLAKIDEKNRSFRTLLLCSISAIIFLIFLFFGYIIHQPGDDYNAADKHTIRDLRKQVAELKKALANIPEYRCEKPAVKVKVKRVLIPQCNDE